LVFILQKLLLITLLSLHFDPANACSSNTTSHGDADTLLTFVHDFQELIHLKGVTEDYKQQVQIVWLWLQDDALEKFNGHCGDPVLVVVDPRAANDVQEATREQNQTN
jgi:hypothetical protein